MSKTPVLPIPEACKRDDADAVEAILRTRSNPISEGDARYWLYSAAQKGAINVVKRIISWGYDANTSRDPDRLPPEGPLFPAVMSGNLELVRWLLEQGAISECLVPGEDEPRNFALSTAVSDGRLDIVQLLVEYGANVNVYYGNRTPVSESLAYGHKDIADYLRSKGGKTPEELGVVKPKKGRKK